MKKSILILICFFLFACSVQKRKYLNGYYISWNQHSVSKNNQLGHAKLPTVSIHNLLARELISKKNKQHLQEQVNLKHGQNTQTLVNDSCDVIIFRDGSEILAKVIEISSTQVKYKRCDLLNGPIYTAKKSEIFMIKYAEGVREVFKEEPNVPANVSPSKVPDKYEVPRNSINSSTLQKVHPKAISAFVIGLLSFLSFFAITSPAYPLLFLFAIIGSIIAIVASAKAVRIINNYPNEFKGKGLAITGRVFSIIVLSILALAIILVLVAI